MEPISKFAIILPIPSTRAFGTNLINFRNGSKRHLAYTFYIGIDIDDWELVGQHTQSITLISSQQNYQVNVQVFNYCLEAFEKSG